MDTNHEPEEGGLPAEQAVRGHARGVVTAATAPPRPVSDPYDAIVWRLRSSEANPGSGFAVGVLGCHSRCGATTVAANSAIRFAEQGGGPVLLVDCNTTRPMLSKTFQLGDVAGLGEASAGTADLSDCIHSSKVAGLDVMPLGPAGLLTTNSVTGGQFEHLLSEVRNDYAVILLDLPPADKLVGPALPIAQQTDAVMLVLRSQSTKRRAASDTLQRLRQDGVPIIGSVVTRRRSLSPRWFGSRL